MLKKFYYILSTVALLYTHEAIAQTRNNYKEPTWKPRPILPYSDAINNDFWPASPKVEMDYNDALFDESRLAEVPALGIYPRVLITPTDVERIQQKIALGENAPAAFKVMWQRVSKLQSPFYALIKNDSALGRKLALELAQKVNSLSPKIDELDKQLDRDNIWAAERSVIATGEPNPPVEIWDLLDYDYLHKWMTQSERQQTQQLIAKIVHRRISNFLMVPDHFMINNHEGFGMEYIRLMLLIEGQEGFDKKLFELCKHKAEAMLNWFLDKDGMCYESIKGWLNTSAMVAVGLRKRDLLKHSHLRAKMNFFLSALRWENNEWHIRDEMRASAFHVIWMMHYYHPEDKRLQFLYANTFTTHDFLNNANAKWPDPVGVCYELLLLYAVDIDKNKDGSIIDWTAQKNIDQLQLPVTWQDSARGYVNVRNSWRKDDLKVDFVCKQDFFYGGHEGSENNRITLWKDGVNWIQDNNMLATKATFLQNMLTIDGKGQHWPPVAGNWLGVQENKDAVTATGDGKMGYSFSKVMQVHPLHYASLQLPYYKAFEEPNFDLTRDIQIAFQPSTIAWNDGFAHTDYGPWSGETRLVESYKPFNEVQKAFRTVHVAKGKNPYVLVIDDVQKDEAIHRYDWTICVPLTAELVDVKTPEIVFQNTDPSFDRNDEMILASRHVERDANNKPILKKGEPLCLVKVLWRNTNYGFPVPSLQQFEGYNVLNIPAVSVSPEFKILVYPFKWGEPLPKTSWNKDRTELTVDINNQKDIYHFAIGEAGRTAFRLQRSNNTSFNNSTRPATPVLLVRGQQFVSSDLRYTRNADKIPAYPILDSIHVQLAFPKGKTSLHYTLDGSDPTSSSSVYTQALWIKSNCTLKAICISTDDAFGENKSVVLRANFVVQTAKKGLIQKTVNSQQGIALQVYEINTKPYNDKGFFEATKIMMPDVNKYKPSYQLQLNNFELPYLSPTQPLQEQAKAFFRYTGYLLVQQKAVYQFQVNSCGPVTFDIAQQTVIEATSIFHQQQQIRNGEIVLDKGWHAFNLIVCDPLFWNANSLGNMPFSVNYRINGSTLQNFTNSELASTNKFNSISKKIYCKAIQQVPALEKGFMLSVYDKTGKRRTPDFMEVQNEEPLHKSLAQNLEVSNSRNSIRLYEGYYYANTSGLYKFDLPYRTENTIFLGSTQSSCQAVLKIDQQTVLQRGVYGKHLSGHVYLEKGWHQFSLGLGTGLAACSVTLPEGQTIDIDATNIYRPLLVNFSLNKTMYNQQRYDFFDSTVVQLSYPVDKKFAIRYTTDGTEPTIKSNAYQQAFTITKTMIVKAIAFNNNQPATAVATVQLNKVQAPVQRRLATIRFNDWNGINTYYMNDSMCKVWIATNGQLSKGMQGKALTTNNDTSEAIKSVDVNVSRGYIKAAFKTYNMNMRENELSISVWFKTSDSSGRLFDKEGYNAFGKRYRTVSCTFNKLKLQAYGNRISGGTLQLNQWQHVVLSVNEEACHLYLNGVLVATGAGTKDITTDALDFFTNTKALVDEVLMFDRAIDDKEVHQLFNSKKNN